jgi:hypothetical protein
VPGADKSDCQWSQRTAAVRPRFFRVRLSPLLRMNLQRTLGTPTRFSGRRPWTRTRPRAVFSLFFFYQHRNCQPPVQNGACKAKRALMRSVSLLSPRDFSASNQTSSCLPREEAMIFDNSAFAGCASRPVPVDGQSAGRVICSSHRLDVLSKHGEAGGVSCGVFRPVPVMKRTCKTRCFADAKTIYSVVHYENRRVLQAIREITPRGGGGAKRGRS